MSHTENGDSLDNGADLIIEEAVGKAIERFKVEHPETYKVLVRRIDNPVELVIKSLKQDAYYQKLVAETDEAVDLARIIVGITQSILIVLEKFIGAL